MADKEFELSPARAYELVSAALDVVGSVSAGVHRSIRSRAGYASRPGVSPSALVRLVDALNAVRPGLADKVIS